MEKFEYDQEALFAGIDMVGRTGAIQFEVGYLHDDVPIEEAGWYAHAKYHGARVSVDDHPGPVEAVEALARKLLKDALCKCSRKVTFSSVQAGVRCHWTREGPRWVSQCESWSNPPQQMTMTGRGKPWTAKPESNK